MKKGAKVSVIDADLKGVVVKVQHDRVTIEDENGFHYEYLKKELVEQNQINYEDIAENIKKEESKKISKKHSKAVYTVDLHFEKLVSRPENYESWERFIIQKETLIERIDYCKANFIKKMVVIHGIGDGVLQDLVYDTLKGITGIEYDDNPYFKNSSGQVPITIL